MPRDNVKYEPVWRTWQAGFREAAERGLPVLVSLDPKWSTAGQRLDLVADRDPRLQRALEDSCVPIRVDPLDRPDLEARFLAVCKTLGGVAGPPFLVLLAPGGEVLLPFTSLTYEGDGKGVPSLVSIIEAARSVSLDDFESDGIELEDESTTHCQLDPDCLWGLIDRARGDVAERDNLRRQLDAILAGGVRDQIGRGFHASARDDTMIVPFFEKPLTLNAGMAAVLAEAAQVLKDDELMQLANETASFVMDQLSESPNAQVIAADAHFYTWTPKEFAAVVPPRISKTASLHFNMTLAEVPHVLYSARSAEDIAEYGASSAPRIALEIEEAKMSLAKARALRPPPEVISRQATNRTANTLGWLAVAYDAGCTAVDRAFLVEIWKNCIQPRVRPTGEVWHEDSGENSFREDVEAVRIAEKVLRA